MIDPTVRATLTVSNPAFQEALVAEYARDLPLSVQGDLWNAARDAAELFRMDNDTSVVADIYRVLAPSFAGTFETGQTLGRNWTPSNGSTP